LLEPLGRIASELRQNLAAVGIGRLLAEAVLGVLALEPARKWQLPILRGTWTASVGPSEICVGV
jgi:hypothetical protein